MTFEDELNQVQRDNVDHHNYEGTQSYFSSEDTERIKGAIIATWDDEPVYFQDDGQEFPEDAIRTILIRTYNRICSQEVT